MSGKILNATARGFFIDKAANERHVHVLIFLFSFPGNKIMDNYGISGWGVGPGPYESGQL